MILFDFLIGNNDRHSQNWGFTRVGPRRQINGLHPLYDHNLSFNKETYHKDTYDVSKYKYEKEMRNANKSAEFWHEPQSVKDHQSAVEEHGDYANFPQRVILGRDLFSSFEARETQIKEEFERRAKFLGLQIT